MKTTNNTINENPIYVSFHIGRGGRFHNAGHLSFTEEENFQDLLSRCSDVCTIIDTDEENRPLADADWHVIDGGGNTILEGREAIEAMTGKLDFDGIYDTDYVTTTDNLSDEELEVLWQAYLNEEYMSDELKDEICTLKGMKRVHEVKRYHTNLIAYDQNASTHIDIDGMVGEFSRDEWRDDLAERGFDKLSIEKILDKMEFCATNDTEFFKEEEEA